MKNIKKLTLLTIFAATAFSIQPFDSSLLENYYTGLKNYYTWFENNLTNLANNRTETDLAKIYKEEMDQDPITRENTIKNGRENERHLPFHKRLNIAQSAAEKADPQFARHTALRIAEDVIHATNVAPSTVRFNFPNDPSPEPLDEAIRKIRFSAKKYGIDPDQAEAATRKIYELD